MADNTQIEDPRPIKLELTQLEADTLLSYIRRTVGGYPGEKTARGQLDSVQRLLYNEGARRQNDLIIRPRQLDSNDIALYIGFNKEEVHFPERF